MSIKYVQIRTIVTSLMAVAFLLTDVQAAQAMSNDPSLILTDQQQCGTHSPLFVALGDAYFDLDETHEPGLTSSTDIEQNKLLSRLSTQRFKDGWGQRVNCTANVGQLQAQASNVLLEDITVRRSDLSSPDSEILVTAFEYDEQQKRLRRETVTIPIRADKLLQSSDDRLVSTLRHRQATPIGSYLEETHIDAFISSESIIIEQSVFVNGTLAQWHTWHLPE
ncbi:hypothetical protein [Granulosicoccus antarcticus]|uniref:Uncharacterized protein n=1 Tax=Granulosicoccus antarcticus IMCC3135 TaxID=1192854 RepID=A0A2Z2NZE5_9GAMM|nr:hypothetical protein [Granulosicoccus antarcticus]ASJ72494.1 hypothetical protein IMCC3135_12030 [Granulosicoccus antarcticus IMCC3135]